MSSPIGVAKAQRKNKFIFLSVKGAGYGENRRNKGNRKSF